MRSHQCCLVFLFAEIVELRKIFAQKDPVPTCFCLGNRAERLPSITIYRFCTLIVIEFQVVKWSIFICLGCILPDALPVHAVWRSSFRRAIAYILHLKLSLQTQDSRAHMCKIMNLDTFCINLVFFATLSVHILIG